MKCKKCGDNISKGVDTCPNCGTVISAVASSESTKETEYQLFEDEEIALPDTDFGHNDNSDEENSANVHVNPWDERDFDKSEEGEIIKSDVYEDNNSEAHSSLEDTLDLEFQNKIKSIPPDEYEIICNGIKETFVSDADISDASLSALEYYEFSEFDIQKLIISLYEEMEDDGTIKKDDRPSWLVDNTPAPPESAISDNEEKAEPEPEHEIDIEVPLDRETLRKEKREKAEALRAWKEYEQEATHAISESEPPKSRGNVVLNSRSRVLYSDLHPLHPRKHKGKIAIVFILMVLMVLLYPTLEDLILPKETKEDRAFEVANQSLNNTMLSSNSITDIIPVKSQSSIQDSALYSNYFEYFDSSVANGIETLSTKEKDSLSIASTEVDSIVTESDDTLSLTEKDSAPIASTEVDSSVTEVKEALLSIKKDSAYVASTEVDSVVTVTDSVLTTEKDSAHVASTEVDDSLSTAKKDQETSNPDDRDSSVARGENL